MRLTEQIRKDIETCRSLDKDKRLPFIWDYYKIPISAVLFILAVLILTFTLNAGRGKADLYAVLVNADDTVESAVFDDILARSELPQTGQESGHVDVAAGYRLVYDNPSNTYSDTVQVLATLFGIGDLDLFAADEAVFQAYAEKDAFIDLSLFIDADVLSKHTLVRRTADTGREEVIGIVLTPSSPIHRAGYYSSPVIVGIAANALNLDTAVAFMKALASDFDF